MSEEKQDIIEFLKYFCETEIDYCKLEKTDVLDILNLIDKLQKELEQERKLTNLIIDDFQAENYFINMTNKEVRKYYSKRKELK